ncbi:MAG: hypothetical protein R2883_00755 [Caldisericia bacterium]
MKKRFQYTRSSAAIIEPVFLAGTVFLLVTTLSNLLFSIFNPDSMFPTYIGVGALIVCAVYLLPKIKSDTGHRGVDIDSDGGELFIDGKKIETPTEVNVMRFGTDKDARFQIKFPKGGIIDSREYDDSKRLLTLLPRTFPDCQIQTHIVQSVANTFVIFGLSASLVMFIVSMVIR